LDNALQAYNRAVGSFETRVLVTARKFKDLGAGTEEDIGALDMIDRAPRQLSLAGMPANGEEDAEESAPPVEKHS
jgi:DNA recombination protein RmuC